MALEDQPLVQCGEEISEPKPHEAAHSMACGDSEDEEGVEMLAAPSNFTPFAAGESAAKHACL